MPAPFISNLSVISPCNRSTFSSNVVAGADYAFPEVDGFIRNSLNNSTAAQNLQNGPNALGAGKVSADFQFGTSYDLSAGNQAIIIHMALNVLNNYHTLSPDSDGIEIALFSGSGTTNYAVWEFGGRNDRVFTNSYNPFILFGSNPSRSGGVWDNSNVTGIAVLYKTTSGAQYSINMCLSQILYISGEVVFGGGDIGNPGTIESYANLMSPETNNLYHNLLVSRAGPTFSFGIPISIQSDYFNETSIASGISFTGDNSHGIRNPPQGYYSLTIQPSDNGLFQLNDCQFSSIDSPFDMVINGEAINCNIQLNNNLYTSIDDFILTGQNVDINGGALVRPNTINIQDAYINNLIISESVNPIMLNGDLSSDSSIRVVNPQSDALQLNFTPSDISDIRFILDSDSTINHNSISGTWVLNIDSMENIYFDTLNSNDVTFDISHTLTANTINPSTGGGIVTLDNAVSYNLTLNNLQNSTEVRVYNSLSGVELLGEENINTGEFTGSIPTGVANINISIVSLSYDIIQFNNLPVIDNISIPVQQQIDRWYNNP